MELSGRSSIQDVTGSFDQYGVVGLCRGRQWWKQISNPIKRTYSVYSFFLLNVKATTDRGLYFPCRPIWEDIEFNNLLDENNLMVCKMQVFAHEKLQRPQPVSDRPEPPPLQTPSRSLVQWLHENYRIRIDSCADMMIRMSIYE